MNIFKNGKLVTISLNGKKQTINGKRPTTPTTIPVTGVSITNKITQLTQGNTYQLQTSVLPNNATNKTLTYSTSNSSIATVSSSGLIYAVASGSVTITVKSSNNIADTMTLTIQSANISVTGISISPSNSSINVGQTLQLSVTVSPSDATNQAVIWSSGDESVFTVDQNGLVTSLKEGLNNIYCTSVSNPSVIGSAGITVASTQEPPTTVSEDELPYVSTYYFNPKPYDDEEVVIPIYLTDYNEAEYMLNDNTKRFRLRVEVDGVVSYKENLQAGDHNINLGILTEGEHVFSIQAIDEYSRESHRLFNDLWVVNRQTYPITVAQTYTVTDADLVRHSINNNDSQVVQDMTNNRAGLSRLFREIRGNGYRKCVLPNGTYRINRCIRRKVNTSIADEQLPIQVASGLTVDLNQSTIKLHPYNDSEYGTIGGVENLMITMEDCVDSHVINGTIEGDYAERLANSWIANNNGEPNNAFSFYGGRYNSYENLTITQITGYIHISSFGGLYEKYGGVVSTSEWSDGKAIDKQGNEITVEGKTTSGYYDLSGVIIKKVFFGAFLSFGGLIGKSFFYDLHFYDENQIYMETIKSMQYRSCVIPDGAKYARVTLLGSSTDIGAASLSSHPTNRYCYLKNIDAIDNRTCFAPSACNNLLYDDLRFTRTGQSVTPCAIDFEDGWEQSQDVYVMNCKMIENSGTRTLIDNAGFNHIIENCDKFSVEIRYRVMGAITRNNTNPSFFWFRMGWKDRSKFARTYNNSFSGETIRCDLIGDGGYTHKFKNNTFTNATMNSAHIASVFDDCDMQDVMFTQGYVKNSTITNVLPYLADSKFENCTFEQKEGTTVTKFSFNKLNAAREFINCIFNTKVNFANHNNFGNGIWDGCTFNSEVTIQPAKDNILGDIQFNNCIFKKYVTISPGTTSYIQFNDCTFEGGRNTTSTNVEFNNCIG